MRKVIDIDQQMQFGQVDISKIRINTRCRDEIPQLLLALQHIYCTPELREETFKILVEEVPINDTGTGRPGMSLWQILVLSLLRVNCNWDWDKIHFMADTHGLIRQMMGIGEWDEKTFSLQTLKDNVSLLKPETLDKINVLVVGEGHKIVKKKDEEASLKGKCDSFVLETDVHFPTDINVLLDAIRKIIFLVAALATKADLGGWRKYHDNFKKTKRLYRKCQKMKHSTSKDENVQEKRELLIAKAFTAYLEFSRVIVDRARQTVAEAAALGGNVVVLIAEIENYMAHAQRQINQIERRVLAGEKIPHEEKVFSIFEEHTEWISKGKAGVPVELGLRVCILEDQYGFILHHRVMSGEVDVDVAVPMVEAARENFPTLNGCSFDKGFWSPSNHQRLNERLDLVVLPKKGKLSASDKEREYSDEFIYYRHRHSAVESGINALENHGLDRCRDHGLDGFKRYVALAVLGRNLQKLGAVLQAKELKRRKRKKPPDAKAA